jgi:hypothetical protein
MASVLQSLALPSASQLVRATPCRQRQVSVARGVVGSPRVPGSVRFGIAAAPSSWTLGGRGLHLPLTPRVLPAVNFRAASFSGRLIFRRRFTFL